jgi:RNA polymerase sigma factor (sigma-70 family)
MTDHDPDTETIRLVAAVRDDGGDHHAVDALVRVVRPFAADVAGPLVDRASVDDVVQEATLEMLRQLPMLREPRAFHAWFRLIVRKHADRHRRRQHPTSIVDDDVESDHPTAEDVVERAELVAAVRASMEHIRDRDRVLLDLKYVAEWDDDRLAALLGISRGAVRKRLFDARRRLRPVLAARLDRPLPPTPQETTAMPYDHLFGAVSSPAVLAHLLAGQPAVAETEPPKALVPLVTGFPVIDLLVPLPRGGVAAWRTGSLYLINELIGNLAAGGPAVLVAVGARRPLPNGIHHRFHRLVAPADTSALITVVDVRDEGDEDGVRTAGALAAALAAEGNDVVLALDAVLSPRIAAAQLRAMAGVIGDAGAVTVLTVTQPATGILSDVVSADDDDDGLDLTSFDAAISFTTTEILRGMSPPVDLEQSWSRVVDSAALDEGQRAAMAGARGLLARAGGVRAALSQPFDHGEDWAGHSARHVPLAEAIASVAPLLDA